MRDNLSVLRLRSSAGQTTRTCLRIPRSSNLCVFLPVAAIANRGSGMSWRSRVFCSELKPTRERNLPWPVTT